MEADDSVDWARRHEALQKVLADIDSGMCGEELRKFQERVRKGLLEQLYNGDDDMASNSGEQEQQPTETGNEEQEGKEEVVMRDLLRTVLSRAVEVEQAEAVARGESDEVVDLIEADEVDAAEYWADI